MTPIFNFDASILLWLQNNVRHPILDPIMIFITHLGDKGLFWIVLTLLMLCFRKTRATGVMLLAALTLSFLIGHFAIKPLVARPRPFLVNTNVNLFLNAPADHSFPSGHSATSAACATVLLLREKKLGFIALAVALLIMFSRLYNYVHYPSDVLCGAILGVLCALLTVFVFKKTKLDAKLSARIKE